MSRRYGKARAYARTIVGVTADELYGCFGSALDVDLAWECDTCGRDVRRCGCHAEYDGYEERTCHKCGADVDMCLCAALEAHPDYASVGGTRMA